MPLDAQGYLARVVAPGGYYALAFKRPGAGPLWHRFFPQIELADAVNFLRQHSGTKDAWVGVASYRNAGSRKQDNAEALKCFWYDADIHRDGDGKPEGAVWADERELVGWLIQAKAGGLLVPNLWINSGYGRHLYWIFDTPMPAAQWMPQAQAFRDMLLKLGARGDIGISADSARILRPPETFNHKVPDLLVPCTDITPARIPSSDYPINSILNMVQPYCSGNNLVGTASQMQRGVTRSMLTAAKAGLEKPPPYSFDSIAAQCPQLKRSMDEEGADDGRVLWHLWLNLAYVCKDPEAAHRLGAKHPDYTRADTDRKYAQTEQEHQGKDFGAPLCKSIRAAKPERAAICDACPHWGKIKSPYSLGSVIPGETIRLPSGFRQTENNIEFNHPDDGWILLIIGTISNVQLLRVYNTGMYRLNFMYKVADEAHRIEIDAADLSINPDRMRVAVVNQGIILGDKTARAFGRMMKAWIDQLRADKAWINAPPSFGWVEDNDEGVYLGVAIAGTVYRADGATSPAQFGDRKIHELYQPKGSAAKWREVAEFVMGGDPMLETIVAASFAAPLMHLIGQNAILSVWSMTSGVGKSTAFKVGSAVWAHPITGMSATNDTANSVQQRLGETRIMPVYWDDISPSTPDEMDSITDMVFQVTQGRGKGRLSANIEQREVAHWRTLTIFSSNCSLTEIVERNRPNTDAGTARVFEYQLTREYPSNIEADNRVRELDQNYGQAGRLYATWLPEHIPEVEQLIKGIQQRIARDMRNTYPHERFYVAAIVGILAGAILADKLGLVRFNIKGIYDHLIDVFSMRRIKRAEDIPVADEPTYALRLLEQFIADCVDYVAVTESFVPRGRPIPGRPAELRYLKSPGPVCARLGVHISVHDKEMRIDQTTLKEWCMKRKYPASQVTGLIQKHFQARKARAVLGNGTDRPSLGKVFYYVINMAGYPEMSHYLASPADAGTIPANVVPIRPAE